MCVCVCVCGACVRVWRVCACVARVCVCGACGYDRIDRTEFDCIRKTIYIIIVVVIIIIIIIILRFGIGFLTSVVPLLLAANINAMANLIDACASLVTPGVMSIRWSKRLGFPFNIFD